LSQCSNDDENQLESIHLLATDDIGQSTEADLSNDGTSRSSELDSRVLRGGEGTIVVDDTQHDGQQRDTEDVIAVCEETGAGHEDGADVVPAKGGLVDFGEGEAAALVGVLDVLWSVSVNYCVVLCVAWCSRRRQDKLTAKSLTWLWKALLPPAVFRPAVFAFAMLGQDASFR
jgi:hypothetical protein